MLSEPTVRLAHFSDVHLTARPLGWRPADFLGKRVTGWLNHRLLGRGNRFRQADLVAAALVADLRARRPDGLAFSGDATALGFGSEHRAAAAALTVGDADWPPAVAVPGNHDYYTAAARRQGAFEAVFAPWQQGERLDGETYPFAVRVGPLWLVAVCSAVNRTLVWDAAGRVGRRQRERLAALLRQLGPGPRVVVSHYPLLRKTGRPERYYRRVRDWRAVARTAADGGVILWLHGHNHRPYELPAGPAVPFPTVCAGSATQTGLWTYPEYRVTGRELVGTRRVYDPARRSYADVATFRLELPG